jgi:hypothetical protein
MVYPEQPPPQPPPQPAAQPAAQDEPAQPAADATDQAHADPGTTANPQPAPGDDSSEILDPRERNQLAGEQAAGDAKNGDSQQ